MKLVILSDTHGNQPLALAIIDAHGDADHIVHLGDEIDDACFLEDATGRDIVKVSGNCDCSFDSPRETLLDLEGHTVLITHGDLYNVKTGMERLKKRARAEKADIVLYGHTHLAAIDELDGILYVNPGCLKKGCEQLSYAVLTLENGSVSAKIIPASIPLS
ncbi:metallophosphoesterase family protein [Geobacter pickeringii]|uniref:Phosphoesterase n=1 Tax=Geobacter pickeringii TaxID=345632 RepID=A0A0B5BK88_9BACT|nr:metallophosphoesterase [Geobacter pickeringii]AJE04885.1 phosphoenolpyruvate-protein phosphotransferase [Geobacter pickeringii]